MLYAIDRDLGRIRLPDLAKSLSLPGQPVRPKLDIRHLGIFVAKLHRDGELIWADIGHNERVDRGASVAANRLLGGGAHTAAAALSAALAVASASITVAATDLSLGSITASVTTNEFTTIGLSRVAGVVGTYTAPASLNAVYTQRISKAFSATGTGTAYGAGLFDSTTVSGSNLYVERLFGTSAAVISGDSLTITIDVSN